MPNACDQHFTVVAMKPRKHPGAYASCVDEPKWLADFAVRELLNGATLVRVTCNHAKELMDQYLAWCDEEDKKKAILDTTKRDVLNARRKALKKRIPRNECPGCFSAIYEGAAEQGWCVDCFPRRAQYEAMAATDGSNASE